MLEITNILKETYMPGSEKTTRPSMEEALDMQSFSMQMRAASQQKQQEERKLVHMLNEIKLLPDGQLKMQRLDELQDMVSGMRAQGATQVLDQVADELSLLGQELASAMEQHTPDGFVSHNPVKPGKA